MKSAKLFKNGQSQAVRLPKEYRFEEGDEVFIKKLDDMVVLIPKNSNSVWNTLFDALEDFTPDFLEERSEPMQKREELF
jgi:antitoxin VapB